MHLVLFDIDGTLMDSGGAGTRSMDLAFRELFSVGSVFEGINMAGMTDSQIMKEGLIKHGIDMNGNLDAFIKIYLKHLEIEINNDMRHIKPGIWELLEKLNYERGVRLGLLTGNLEQGARIKLGSLNLNKYFPSGAFGSDDEDRDRLLPVAVKRFEELYGERISFDNCIVVGDTPRDVYCAKPYGAKAIGVATGPYPTAALRKAGADYVFEDFSEHADILRMFF